MFNLKKNLFLEGKMQSLCSGKYLRTLVFLGLSAAPFQWVSAQFNLSLTNPNLGSVIKEIQAQSDYQFFYDDKLASVQLESLNVTDSSLQEVLSKALSGKNISYKICLLYTSERCREPRHWKNRRKLLRRFWQTSGVCWQNIKERI